jgi:hypothetical protein
MDLTAVWKQKEGAECQGSTSPVTDGRQEGGSIILALDTAAATMERIWENQGICRTAPPTSPRVL